MIDSIAQHVLQCSAQLFEDPDIESTPAGIEIEFDLLAQLPAHLVHKAATALARLAPGGISEAQAAALAPLLVHAMQVAAAPDGGAHVGVGYLEELAEGGGE